MLLKVMADLKWLADFPAARGNPLANRVGWFDLNNINRIVGMPLGFLRSSASALRSGIVEEMQALIDEIRKPRGRTVLEEKT
jgi:cation/acetate symporter